MSIRNTRREDDEVEVYTRRGIVEQSSLAGARGGETHIAYQQEMQVVIRVGKIRK
jgi:hypothetical protein